MGSVPETLAELHQRLGARLAPYRGVAAPADYGDETEEYTALRDACGLVDRSWIARLTMLGEDRVRFLNGLVTCDVKSLAPGQGIYGFVTSVKGRVMADVVVLALDDRLWLELPPGAASEIADHLLKYVIVDRVEIAALDDKTPLTLIGPRSAAVLAGCELPETLYSHREISFCGTEARVVRERPFGKSQAAPPAWTLWVRAVDAPACFAELLERGADQGLRPAGHRALDRLRITAGQPLCGLDFGTANFPQETGLEDEAVNYTKGCYLGQEVVARIHYRGGVNRHLRGLVFADATEDAAPVGDVPGAALLVDGREVGRVTSATVSSTGRRIGVAILHQRAAPGAEVEIAGGGTARVVELPFPAAD